MNKFAGPAAQSKTTAVRNMSTDFGQRQNEILLRYSMAE
jgi:hypothetical protein